MVFTNEDFDRMVHEVLQDEPCFDTLCHMVQMTAESTVSYCCRKEDCLRGRDFEEDIMQTLQLKIMLHVITDFLRNSEGRACAEGYNNNPQGFSGWIKRLAENEVKDLARRVRRRNECELLPSEEACASDRREKYWQLQQAFDIVLDARSGVYIVLTWVAQFVFVLGVGVKKVRSAERIVRLFENKTLFEMYTILLDGCRYIPWLVVSEERQKQLQAALCARDADGNMYGDRHYGEFFMVKNGEPAGKLSVSNWVNRMNGLIKRKMGDPCETDPPQKKRDEKKEQDKTRRDDREPFDSESNH